MRVKYFGITRNVSKRRFSITIQSLKLSENLDNYKNKIIRKE